MTEFPDPRRRSFGPVVLLGLGSGGLAAVAGNRAWARADGNLSAGLITGDTSAGDVPLAGALALVSLAAWGVLLVVRARVRRAFALLATVVAVGMVVTAVVGYSSSVDALAAELAHGPAEDAPIHHTGWVWLYLGAAVVGTVVAALAVRLAPGWPEMGSRYDAPGGAGPPRDASDLELWKALDDGRDPTLTEPRQNDP